MDILSRWRVATPDAGTVDTDPSALSAIVRPDGGGGTIESFANLAACTELQTGYWYISTTDNLYVDDTWYEVLWTATVDGAPAPLLRTNALFRGVPLTAGRHRIEMSYLPRSVVRGAVLSALGLAGLLALALLARRRPAY